MYDALSVSTSGLIAARTRLNIATANVANANTLTNELGEYEPWRRRIAIQMAGDPASGNPSGVHISEIIDDETPLKPRFQPNSPFADADGMVMFPNVNPVIEQMNAMEATRSYEANITAIEATKSMMSVALELLV